MSKREPCPKCGFLLERKWIRKQIRGGNDVAVTHTPARVCRRCHEWVFPIAQVREFERIKKRLERGDTDGFRPLGRTFELDLPESAWDDNENQEAPRAPANTETGG